jgi:hypothetical protein
MPIQHIVLFRFRTDLAEGTIAALFTELRGLADRIPGITSFSGGAYRSPEGLARGFSHGFCMTFADEAARDAYLPHPEHQAIVARLLPLLDGGLDGALAFDYADGVV